MSMNNPPHPGLSIKHNCLDPLGLSVTEAAALLGVDCSALTSVLNGQARISAEMATLLEKAGWSSAGFWVRRQAAYDRAGAAKNKARMTG